MLFKTETALFVEHAKFPEIISKLTECTKNHRLNWYEYKGLYSLNFDGECPLSIRIRKDADGCIILSFGYLSEEERYDVFDSKYDMLNGLYREVSGERKEAEKRLQEILDYLDSL